MHIERNLGRIVGSPNIRRFTWDIYQTPGVAETVKMDDINNHYCQSHRHTNPFGTVPDGSELDFESPHGRS